MTRDKNEWIRYKAVMELRHFEEKKVVESLIDRLSNDVNPTIQAYAAESLQYHKDKSSVVPLFHALDHKEPEVRECAAVALGWMEARSAIASIKEKLKKERSPRAKMRFYVALYSLGEKEHIYNIYSFLANRSPYMRESTAGYISLLPIDREIKKKKLEEIWEQETVDWVKSSISDKLKMLE
ncbi:HEAT repeat domain-containing protein [Shimazuella kribbensis]|uniref:HEAT repeat domain-containing protein n=1 Tax=Shimazuella kribbensis TaxID=139808 RepID=UPI001471CF0E|nr:HEAT repeat domain-containing protein [Shimazuella kribbensis]